MDLQRSCYYSYMRLYRDRPDILTYGRWHFCPPGALPAPPSVFFARRSDLDDTDEWPLGEVYQKTYKYSHGRANARLTGQHYCGDPAVWLNGNLYGETLKLDVSGVPLCCQAGPPPPTQLALGGAGRRVRVGQGALVLGSQDVTIYGLTACQCADNTQTYP